MHSSSYSYHGKEASLSFPPREMDVDVEICEQSSGLFSGDRR